MKQQIIILEGHDTAGKSSIAKELSKILGIPVLKAQRDKRWWDPMINLLYFTEATLQVIEQTKVSVILDRFHPSDYMYSKLFDRDISYRKIEEIDGRLAQLGAKIIICHKKKKYQIEDVEDADFVNKKMYNTMTKLYKQFADQHTKCKVHLIDTSDENLEKQITQILTWLE